MGNPRRQPSVLSFLIAAGFLAAAGPALAGQTKSTPGYTRPSPPDPHAQIVRLLQSTDPREQAWGAWLTGRDQIRALIPSIQRLVSQRLGTGSTVDHTIDVALDALIHMQASLTLDVLAGVYAERPAHALILASHAGEEADEFLLDIVGQGKDTPWFAAANLLLERKKTALTAAILKNLRLEVSLYIVRSGSIHGGGGRGGGVGCGGSGRAPGFPPLAAYSLTTSANPGVVVLATGPTPVYYRRTLSRAGETPSGSASFITGPTARDRITYLAALAGMTEQDLPIQGHESHSVQLEGNAGLAVEVDRIRADVHRRMGLLMQALVRVELLTGRDAGAWQPPIDVSVHDLRDEQPPGPNNR